LTEGEVQSVQRLARLYIDGRTAEAFGHCTRALQMYQSLATCYPNSVEYQANQAQCLKGLGNIHLSRGALDEAERLYFRASQIYEALMMRPEARAQTTRGLTTIHHNLGVLKIAAGRFSEAEDCWRRAVDLSAQTLRDSPTSPQEKQAYSSNLEGMAEALKALGRWLDAEQTLRAAIRIQEPLAAELPERTEFPQDLALSLCSLGGVLHHLGQCTEGEELFRRSIGISKRLVNAIPTIVFRRALIAEALIELATFERDNEHFDALKELVDEASCHIRVGLEINPANPDLNKLNGTLDSLVKGMVTTKPTGVRPHKGY
jgi:tetratricopeptide (TPR) repeat protein